MAEIDVIPLLEPYLVVDLARIVKKLAFQGHLIAITGPGPNLTAHVYDQETDIWSELHSFKAGMYSEEIAFHQYFFSFYSTSVRRYDLIKHIWVNYPPLPGDWNYTNRKLVVVGGVTYVLMSRNNAYLIESAFYRSDGGLWESLSPIKYEYDSMRVAVIKTTIYICSPDTLAPLAAYDTLTNTWTELSQPMCIAELVAINDDLYVFQYLKGTMMIYCATKEWELIDTIKGLMFYYSNIAAVGTNVYILNLNSRQLKIYDMALGELREFAIPPEIRCKIRKITDAWV